MIQGRPMLVMDSLVLTLDIDWAPDFVIDHVAQRLIEHQVCATWFVTHASPAVDRLRRRPDLFELGIHPNFFPGSTQSQEPRQDLKFCLDLDSQPRRLRFPGLC